MKNRPHGSHSGYTVPQPTICSSLPKTQTAQSQSLTSTLFSQFQLHPFASPFFPLVVQVSIPNPIRRILERDSRPPTTPFASSYPSTITRTASSSRGDSPTPRRPRPTFSTTIRLWLATGSLLPGTYVSLWVFSPHLLLRDLSLYTRWHPIARYSIMVMCYYTAYLHYYFIPARTFPS